MVNTETLVEYCAAGSGCRLDRGACIIRSVKVLGLRSKNGREYLPGAVAAAAALYEGAKVHLNHPRGNPNVARDYQDRIGVIRGVRAAADGLYGDLHYNPKHPIAEQLAWDAEHAPENVGLSHNIEGRTSRNRDGKLVVEEIVAVQSVDLVADPATTRGLFEFEGQDGSGDAAAALAEADLPHDAAEFLAAITDQPAAAADASALVDDEPDAAGAADFAGQVTGVPLVEQAAGFLAAITE